MSPDPPTKDPTHSLKATFRGIGAVVAPTSAVTALLYYFGWTRTSVEATELGLDDSLLGYSTQDYLLRSMSSMFAPLVVALVTALAGLGAHVAISAWARGQGRRQVGRLAAGVAVVGLLLLLAGVVGSQVGRPSPELYVGAPVGVTVGIVLLAYAANLGLRLLPDGGVSGAPDGMGGYRVLVSASIVMLLILSLFWNVSHYAVVKGRNLATTVETELPSRPGVIIYSAKRLYLQAPVVETRLDPENAAYNYAYTGLKLLFRSDRNYFLRPSDSGSRVNIVLPDGLDIRLELFEP
jgi:hypothetical protein